MKPLAHSVQPPRVAVWLLNLFTIADEEESIQGDLLEEFSQIALTSGFRDARRWYWRQAIKTIPHLAASGFRAAPLSTIAVVIAGYLLGRFAYGLPDKILMAATDRYISYWQIHFKMYVFFSTDGMLVAHLIASMFVGCVVALAAKGREMAATMMLGLVLGAMGAVGVLWWIAKTGDSSFLWMLGLRCADSFAIVAGGVIVRMYRPHSTLQSQ